MAGKRVSRARHIQNQADQQQHPSQDAQGAPVLGWKVEDCDQKLLAVFDREAGLEPNIVNLTRWKELGAAYDVLARAFCIAYRDSARSTRTSDANSFTSGFVRFAVESGLQINCPDDVPAGIGNAFVGYLNAKVDDELRFSLNTQHNYHKSYKKIVEALHKLAPEWECLSVAHQPFAGKKIASKAKEDPGDKLRLVMTAAAEKAKETMDRIWPSLPKLHKEIQELREGRQPKTLTAEATVAWILSEFDGNYPRLKTVRTLPGLSKMKEEEYFDLRRIAHPIGIDLTPFFLVMSLHTGFNEQPLRELKLSGIIPIEVLGQTRTLLKASKTRAGSSQAGAPQRRAIPASDYDLSAERIIRFLTDWTERIRSHAMPQIEDDLFLHVVSEGGKKHRRGLHVDSYAGVNDNYNSRVTQMILTFCQTRGLKYAATRDNRLAFSNLVSELSGSDALELKRLLGHKRVSTGQESYQTAEMQKRDRELISGAIAAHQRFINSGGKIDSRKGYVQGDRTAATPGFMCADPFQSPQVGERDGRLCVSYGKCPACPLAMSDTNQAYALARYLQLKELFERAIGELGIEIWKIKFGESFKALIAKWIPAVDSKQNRDASSRIVLAGLPPLE